MSSKKKAPAKAVPIKLESGIKMPPRMGSRSGTKYPIKDMKVGQSFVVSKAGAANAAANYGRKHKLGTFAVRKTPDGQHRVFRIK